MSDSLFFDVDRHYTFPPDIDQRVLAWAMGDPYILWAIRYIMALEERPQTLLGADYDPDLADVFQRSASDHPTISFAAGIQLVRALYNNYTVTSVVNSRYAILTDLAELEGGLTQQQMQPLLRVLRRATVALNARIGSMTGTLVAQSRRFGIAAHDIISGNASTRYFNRMANAEAREMERLLGIANEIDAEIFSSIEMTARARNSLMDGGIETNFGNRDVIGEYIERMEREEFDAGVRESEEAFAQGARSQAEDRKSVV